MHLLRQTPFAAALSLLPLALRAQTAPASDLPAFAVSSVHLNVGPRSGWTSDFTLNGYTATNETLKSLLQDVYGLQMINRSVKGMPSWYETKRFDIEAKVDEADIPRYQSLTRDQQKEMLLHLLAERFHLDIRTEDSEEQIYNLVLAESGVTFLGTASTGPTRQSHRGTEFTTEALTTAGLAEFLSFPAGRPVIDKTGLTGAYSFHLTWSSDPDSNPSVPTLPAAVEKQLGLKLVPAKGSIPHLVIDHVELPADN